MIHLIFYRALLYWAWLQPLTYHLFQMLVSFVQREPLQKLWIFDPKKVKIYTIQGDREVEFMRSLSNILSFCVRCFCAQFGVSAFFKDISKGDPEEDKTTHWDWFFRFFAIGVCGSIFLIFLFNVGFSLALLTGIPGTAFDITLVATLDSLLGKARRNFFFRCIRKCYMSFLKTLGIVEGRPLSVFFKPNVLFAFVLLCYACSLLWMGVPLMIQVPLLSLAFLFSKTLTLYCVMLGALFSAFIKPFVQTYLATPFQAFYNRFFSKPVNWLLDKLKQYLVLPIGYFLKVCVASVCSELSAVLSAVVDFLEWLFQVLSCRLSTKKMDWFSEKFQQFYDKLDTAIKKIFDYIGFDTSRDYFLLRSTSDNALKVNKKEVNKEEVNKEGVSVKDEQNQALLGLRNR